jgi:selenocysteine-specific elongation factor
VFSSAERDDIRARAGELVTRYHAANPLRPGMPLASLAEQLGLTPDELSGLVEGALVVDGSIVRDAGFAGTLDPDQRATLQRARQTLLAAGLAVPRASQLDVDVELRHALERSGDLVRIDDDLVYLPEQVAEIEAVARAMDGDFTVSQFRDACGMSRRQAVPVLEWLDRRGVTERSGDVRRVRA